MTFYIPGGISADLFSHEVTIWQEGFFYFWLALITLGLAIGAQGLARVGSSYFVIVDDSNTSTESQ